MRWLRHTTRWRTLACIAVAVCVVVLACLFQSRATVVADPFPDRIPKYWIGDIPDVDTPGWRHLKPRVVLGVEVALTNSTSLTRKLYAVRRGSVEQGSSFTFTRHSYFPWPVGPILERQYFRVLLCEHEIEGFGHAVSGGETFFGSGGGSGGCPILHDFDVSSSVVLPGPVPYWGAERIIYVEGDTAPNVTSSMSVHEFAQTNDGNYTLITMRRGGVDR